MVKAILVEKDGNPIEINLHNVSEHFIYDNYNKSKLLHSWKMNDSNVLSIFGSTNGKAGYENKLELPPPIDNILCFNKIVIIMSTQINSKNELKLLHCRDLCKSKWILYYEELFGGFESLNSDDDIMSEDEFIENGEYTKEGYLKDGFVVDGSDDESDDESDEEYL